MFLYEKVNDKVLVYEIEPKKNQIRQFKKQSLSDNNNLIYNACAYDPLASDHCYLSSSKDFMFWEELNNTKHKLIVNNNGSLKKSILSNYYNGIIDNYKLIKTKKDGKDYGLLVPISSSIYPNKITSPIGDNYILKGILLIPNSLYLLEAFKRRKYHMILRNNIDKQLKLYSPLLKIDELSINDVLRFSRSGLLKDNIDDVMTDISYTTKLVKKKRRVDRFIK